MKTIRPAALAPEIQVLFTEWAVPTTEYTSRLFTYANTMLQIPNDHRIGDMVVAFGLATREEVELHAKTKPGNMLVLEHLSERIENIRVNAQKLLAANDHLAYYDFVPAGSIHPALHENEPLRKFCIARNCLPLIGYPSNCLRVLFADYAALKEYRESPRLNRMTDPLGTLCASERLSLQIVYGIAERNQLLSRLYDNENEATHVVDQEDHVTIWSDSDAETDIERLLARILTEAITKKASNIKFTPLHNGTVELSYRRHGDLRPFKNIRPLSPEEANEMLRFLHIRTSARYTSSHKRVEGRLLEPADGNLVFRTGTSETFLRCGFIPAGNDSLALQRESVSIRLLDRSAVTICLRDLNLAPGVIREITIQLQQKHGLILVVGPTSSGKSTTVAGMVTAYREIYGNTRNLLSLEQPIERLLEGITQVQVSQNRFEAYMAAFLRHDPNFIWVGEIRDRPSASTCVRSSNTGQIVVSTLHSDDAPQAPNALLAYISNNLGSSADSVIVTPYDAINALSLIIAQRLVPELCPRCKIPFLEHEPNQANEQLDRYRHYCKRNDIAEQDVRQSFLRKPEGCAHCDHEGYVGERPINEILPITKQLRQKLTALVNAGQFDNELLAQARTYTLHDDAMRYVAAGVVSLADALI